MKYAAVGPIAVHLPERVETNEELQRQFPDWDLSLIASKTGIHARHIAAEGETAADLGVAACEKLFREREIDPASIDFLLFCTQTPDYPLPTTACLLQQRLGLSTHVGALDFNLGCSGYVYGLALADGLMRTGSVKRALLVTSETYSKYIDQGDRSLRTIFGDGAAATLIEAHDEPTLFGYQYGTDGTGADTLIVNKGGARKPAQAIKPRHRHRWGSALYMDGPSLISFTVTAVPKLIDDILAASGRTKNDIHSYLLHQATLKMLQQLQQRLSLDESRMPIHMETVGNTVSSTLPILISELRGQGRLPRGSEHLMIGFGVGWSWAGCVWKEAFDGSA